MIIKNKLTALLFCCLCIYSSIGVSLEQSETAVNQVSALSPLKQCIITTPHSSGEFTQEKSIKILSRPIKTSGTFVIDQTSKTLEWQQKKPIQVTYFMKGDQLNRIDAKGNNNLINVPKSSPQFMMIETMLSALQGDISALEKTFTTSLEIENCDWQLTLLPKQNHLSAFIKQLKIIGTSRADSIIFVEKSDDKTVISFQYHD